MQNLYLWQLHLSVVDASPPYAPLTHMHTRQTVGACTKLSCVARVRTLVPNRFLLVAQIHIAYGKPETSTIEVTWNTIDSIGDAVPQVVLYKTSEGSQSASTVVGAHISSRTHLQRFLGPTAFLFLRFDQLPALTMVDDFRLLSP